MNDNGLVRVAVGICLVGSCLGCRYGQDDVNRRVQHTIAQLERHAPSHPAIEKLKAATPESLLDPDIVFVRLVNHSRRVFVSWVEAKPTADGLQLTCEATGLTKLLRLDRWQNEANAQELKDGCGYEMRRALAL